jgi:hypothetical protein
MQMQSFLQLPQYSQEHPNLANNNIPHSYLPST